MRSGRQALSVWAAFFDSAADRLWVCVSVWLRVSPGYISLAILAITMCLFVQKLCLLPNALLKQNPWPVPPAEGDRRKAQ